MTAATAVPLHRDPVFVRYWVARTVSLVGSATSRVILPVLVYDRTRSAALTGLISAAQFGPYLVFGLVAGAAADRVDRRRVMVGAEVLSAVLLLTVPVAAALGMLSTGHLLAVAFLAGSLYVWFDAANFGALPTIAGRARLPAAVAAVSTSSTVADVAGPLLVGALLVALAPATALLGNAGALAVSALLLLTLPTRATRRATGAPPPGALGGEVLTGLRFLWGEPLIRWMTLLAAGLGLTTGTVLGLLVVYADEGLGLQPRDPQVSLLYAALAAGGLAGSLLVPRLVGIVPPGRAMLLTLAVNLAALLGLAAVGSVGGAAVLLAVFALGYVSYTLLSITLRQQLTPDELSGRVNTTARMLAVGAQPLGALVGGALVTVIGIRPTLVAMAAGVLASAVLGWFSPVRHATTPLPD